EAVALLDTLAHARFREADWGPLLEDVARSTGPDTATRTLDALLVRARVPLGARGRLLLADGGRLSAAGRAPAAEARYAQVVGLVPDSLEGQQAQVRVLRALAAQTDSMPDLVAVRARLGRLGQGAAAGEARALEALLRRVLDAEAGEGSQFRTAEPTRHSLGAPRRAAPLREARRRTGAPAAACRPAHPPGLAVTAVRLFGVDFQNPVLLASGTAGFGREVEGVIDLDTLGGIVTKAVTLEPRRGHAAPRVAEFAGGMLNAVGLANPGLATVREHELPWLAARLTRARVLVNVAGATVADY